MWESELAHARKVSCNLGLQNFSFTATKLTLSIQTGTIDHN